MGGGLGLVPDIDQILEGLNKYNDYEITLIAGKNRAFMMK